MMRDQKLLEEAYQSIYESVAEPLYFGPDSQRNLWMHWLYSRKHEIHPDGSVSMFEDARLSNMGLLVIPFKFKRVEGYFTCERNQITTLEGAPEIVLGGFECHKNRLKSLLGAPKEIGGHFNCSHNMQLMSLEHCPQVINGFFNCFNCKLTSFKGGPKIVKGNFHCGLNDIRSLEGAPEEVGDEFFAEHFSDDDYRAFIKKRKRVETKLDKDLNIDLGDFS